MPVGWGDVSFCIVEPELRLRETLRALLSVEFEARILTSATLAGLLAQAELVVPPAIVIVGDNPGTPDGIGEIVAQVHKAFPQASVIALFAKDNRHRFSSAVALLKGPLDATRLIETIHHLGPHHPYETRRA